MMSHQSIWRRTLAGMLLLCVGLATIAIPCVAADEEAKALTMTLQEFDKVGGQQYPWGWIRWLMNAEIDPAAEMTFGMVYIKPHQENPLHLHPGSTEYLHVLEGSCEHLVGKEWLTLKAGDTLRIPKNAPHRARTKEQSCRAVIVYNTGKRQFVPLEEEKPGQASKSDKESSSSASLRTMLGGFRLQHGAGELQANEVKVPGLKVDLIDRVDPVFIGAETTCAIRITNEGFKPTIQVTLECSWEDGLGYVGAETHPAIKITPDRQKRTVSFTPFDIEQGKQLVYQVQLEALKVGDLKFTAKIITDQLKKPVIVEETTRAYNPSSGKLNSR